MNTPWNKLSRFSKEEFRALQNKKLRAFVRHQLMFSPYYRELFTKHNLSPMDIATTDDLVKIPFTTKEDLAPREDERTRPRKFILQPDEQLIKQYFPKGQLLRLAARKLAKKDVKAELEWEYKPVHLHFTTGRSALPTPFAYTSYDVERLKESGKRLLDVSGISHDSVAINGFPYSPHLAFWLAYYAMTTIRMLGLHSGGGKIMGTEKIIDAIQNMKASVVVFIPGYCYHLLRRAVALKKDFSNVKHVIFGGERVSPGLRDKVRELLGQLGAHEVEILATYAMTEGKTAWIQCGEQTGYHLYPDMEFFEVIDENGKRVPEGPGELVYTALDWRGSVVVRYRTGDRTLGIDYGACPNCGRTVPRILPDLQRVTEIREFNLTKVKGEFVNLNNFYPVLSGMKELEEWQIEIGKVNNDPFEVDELRLFVSMKNPAEFDHFVPILQKKIEEAVNVSVKVQQLPLSELLERLGMETELKEKRILDVRPKS